VGWRKSVEEGDLRERLHGRVRLSRENQRLVTRRNAACLVQGQSRSGESNDFY
jgi:hypothetical protein